MTRIRTPSPIDSKENVARKSTTLMRVILHPKVHSNVGAIMGAL
jgi:hypothetical protein